MSPDTDTADGKAQHDGPLAFDDILLKNDEETAGACIPKDEYMESVDSSKISLDNIESMVGLCRELGWETLRVSTAGDCEPVFIESADDGHGTGALAIAPIYPTDDDGEGDDD